MTIKQTIQSVELLTRNALQKDLNRDEVTYLICKISLHIFYLIFFSLVLLIHLFIILVEEMHYFRVEELQVELLHDVKNHHHHLQLLLQHQHQHQKMIQKESKSFEINSNNITSKVKYL